MAMMAMVAMSALSAVSSIYQGQQAAAQANEQAKVTEMQGEMANLNARSQAAEIQNEAARLKARQISQGAKAGVSLDSGSFLSLVSSSAAKAEEDRRQVLRSGLTTMYSAGAEASQIRAAGQTQKTGSYFSAAGSLLKGFSGMQGGASSTGWFS